MDVFTSSSPFGLRSTAEKPWTFEDGQNWKFNLVREREGGKREREVNRRRPTRSFQVRLSTFERRSPLNVSQLLKIKISLVFEVNDLWFPGYQADMLMQRRVDMEFEAL